MKRVMNRRWLGRTLVIAGLGLGAGGCAADRVGAPMVETLSEAVVRVENRNWADVTVRVARAGGSSSQRLGTVTSMQTARLTIPQALLGGPGRVRLIADPIGGARPFVTEPISVRPGQTIEFTLEGRLNLSNWSVW